MAGFKLDIEKAPVPHTLFEQGDRDVLRALVEHPELLKRLEADYKEKVRKSSQTASIKKLILNRNLIKDLQKYSASYTSKGVCTKYKFGKGSNVGRVYPEGPSLGNFPKVIRELLSHSTMKDFDFANSAPSDLEQLMHMHNIATPLLTEYVNDKDNVLQRITDASELVKRGNAKAAVLQVIMGGGLRFKADDETWVDLSHLPWMVAFHAESTLTQDSVCSLFPDVYSIKQDEDNPKGKTVAQVLFRIEWHNLDAFVRYLKSKKMHVHVTIHDGLQASGREPLDMLQAASDYIFEATGFRKVIVEKPIKKHDLTALLQSVQPLPPHTPVSGSKLSKYMDSGEESNSAVTKEYLETDLFTKAAKWADFISCKAGMKMGKTERTMEFIRPHYDARRSILFICQRKTMVRSLEARTGDPEDKTAIPLTADEVQMELAKYGMRFECYDCEACKGIVCSKDHPFLICEYESLHRVQGKFDYCILDEFRSTASTMVASTNGDRIAQHWDTLKELCSVAQKVLFLDADMCVDSCAYKIQDLLMKHRTEFRLQAIIAHYDRLAQNGDLLPHDQQQLSALQQFLRESRTTRACTCCGSTHAVNGICRIENAVHKMKKTLRLSNKDEMLLRLGEDAVAGKRVAIACGSVHEAVTLKAFLSFFATGSVGLYTGNTDNSDHFIDLAKHWDPLQIIIYTSTLTTGADYCTPVDRFYVFPHHNTCTPRDMHQMLGRIRDLQDTEVWVQASAGCRHKLRTITRDDVEKRIQQCTNQVWFGGKVRGAVHTEHIEKLRFTVGPNLYEHKYTPAPPEIVLLKGYDDAERSYSTSNHEWMSYFLYMAELKNYSIVYACDEERDEQDLNDVKEQLKQCSKDIAEQEHAEFEALDISEFRDVVSIQMLQWIGSGKFFKGHEEFFDNWNTRFGQATLYTFKLMARKAQFSMIYTHPAQHNNLQDLKAYERCKHAILCYTAVDQERSGNQSIMTELTYC
jgi:hypothetical protein